MARVTSGISKGFSGSLDGYVFKQQKDGTTTVSVKPEPSDKEPTVPQLRVQQDTKICSVFLRLLKDYIEVGYELEAKRKKSLPNNVLASAIRLGAITGDYPDRRIDYSKVLVTKGKMVPPQQVSVSLTEAGFHFSWNTEVHKGEHFSDQIMILAYFPELKKVVSISGGAQRLKGEDVLMLGGVAHGFTAEMYISFITDNRKAISDSVYLGQLNW